MTTPLTDALSYLTLSLSTDPNPTPLVAQLAVACANHPQARELLEVFIGEFTKERGRLNFEASLRKMTEEFEVSGWGLR